MACLEHSGYTLGHIRLSTSCGMRNTLYVQHYIMHLVLYIFCFISNLEFYFKINTYLQNKLLCYHLTIVKFDNWWNKTCVNLKKSSSSCFSYKKSCFQAYVNSSCHEFKCISICVELEDKFIYSYKFTRFIKGSIKNWIFFNYEKCANELV